MAKKNSKESKFDVDRDIVTAQILKQLEAGIIPWHKPWFGALAGSLPVDYSQVCYGYVKGNVYNSINQCLLNEAGGYVTWDCLNKLGGKMLEGHTWKEHRQQIVKFYRKPIELKDKNGDPVLDDKGNPKVYVKPMMRYDNVVNVKYTTLPPKEFKTRAVKPDRLTKEDLQELAESVIKDYTTTSGVTFQHALGDRAFYRPADDSVTVPLIMQFKQIAEYYSVAFHELVHSTGHWTRENRFKTASLFGDEPYAREELVAEFGAAILNHWCGLATDNTVRNSAAYIQSWAKAIKEDPKMFGIACFNADRAVKRILGDKVEMMEDAAA